MYKINIFPSFWHFFINFTMVEFGLVRSVGASQLREGGRQYHGRHGWHGVVLTLHAYVATKLVAARRRRAHVAARRAGVSPRGGTPKDFMTQVFLVPSRDNYIIYWFETVNTSNSHYVLCNIGCNLG